MLPIRFLSWTQDQRRQKGSAHDVWYEWREEGDLGQRKRRQELNLDEAGQVR